MSIDLKIGDSARRDTLAKMQSSRAEIRRLLEPPEHAAGGAGADTGAAPGAFPRSRTMRLLLSGRGIGTVGAVLGGLVIARPALALRVLRMIPAGAVGRMLLIKGIAALRNRRG
jgi:hypothetical protein